MCGPTSAIGLGDLERACWLELRERLREPGRLSGVMRGVLGGDAEVAVVVSVTPAGIARPQAILTTPAIVDEIEFLDDDVDSPVRRGRIGDDEVEVLTAAVDDGPVQPVALRLSDWMREHLTVYARELWHRRR